MTKLLRTIQFDSSDAHVYQAAAPAGAWAVSGAFEFADLDQAAFVGKTRQAFANAFLGVPSFGRATFAAVSHATHEERTTVHAALTGYLMTDYGAPSQSQAEQAAEAEIAFIEDLCADMPVNTVFTVRRQHDRTTGDMTEEFRIVTPPADGPQHTRIWSIEAEPTEDQE